MIEYKFKEDISNTWYTIYGDGVFEANQEFFKDMDFKIGDEIFTEHNDAYLHAILLAKLKQ